MKVIKIFTDGGYRRKSKIGAYSCVILVDNVVVKEIAVAIPDDNKQKVTNNTMELQAVIRALKEQDWLISNGCKPKETVVYLWTDSQYVQLGLTNWIHNWIRNDWKTSSNKKVLNETLWKELYNNYIKVHKIFKIFNIQWVEGHSGQEWNERADKLCNKAMDDYLINVDYEQI